MSDKTGALIQRLFFYFPTSIKNCVAADRRRKGVSNLKSIQQTAQLLAGRFSPKRLILFSRKTDLGGKTASFKLCMVAGISDKRAAQREIFLQTEGMPPFDVLIYTPQEWTQALAREGSFAQRIERTGCDLLGKD